MPVVMVPAGESGSTLATFERHAAQMLVHVRFQLHALTEARRTHGALKRVHIVVHDQYMAFKIPTTAELEWTSVARENPFILQDKEIVLQ